MKRTLIASVLLLIAALNAEAYADARHDGRKAARTHKPPAAQSSSRAVTYNRDSKNPNIGWHWEGGMRTCHQDCDNPEIPGSGYTCKNVKVFGMAMRECDSSN